MDFIQNTSKSVLSEAISMLSPEAYHTQLFIDFGIDLIGRKIVLDEEVDDDFASIILKSCEILKVKKEPVTIIINCPGGDVYAGLSIIDSFKILKKAGCKVIMRVQGSCMSMAAIILATGDLRQATEYSQIMIHQGQQFIMGRFDETKLEMKQNNILETICNDILVTRCKQDLEYIEKVQEKGNFYLDAKKALKFGIIDEII